MGTKGSASSLLRANPGNCVCTAATANGNCIALRRASGGIPLDWSVTGAAPDPVEPGAAPAVVVGPPLPPTLAESFRGRPRPLLIWACGAAAAARASKGTAAPEGDPGVSDTEEREDSGVADDEDPGDCGEALHSLLPEFCDEGVD